MHKILLERNITKCCDDPEIFKALTEEIASFPIDSDIIKDMQEQPLPDRQTKNAAGYDLFLPYSVTIPAGRKVSVFTGVTFSIIDAPDIPFSPIMAFVSARSSLLKKKGLLIPGRELKFGPGEPMVFTIENTRPQDVVLEKGERFAQVVFRYNENEDARIFGVGDRNLNACIEPVINYEGEYVAPNIREGLVFFQTREEVEISPKTIRLIKTDIKSELPGDFYLRLIPNHSLEAMFGICLANGVGVIDADYYGNIDNDGNIGFQYFNNGSVAVTLPRGILLGLGITHKYFIAENEDTPVKVREGGFGHTN